MKTYTIAALKKMSTSRLMDLHVALVGAFPADIEDRTNMICRIMDIAWDAAEKAAHESKIAAGNEAVNRNNVDHGKPFARSLTKFDIIAIIAQYDDGMSTYKLGKMYGKGAQFIKNIVTRKIYKDVRIGWSR